jgi:hypothetical protein
MLLRENPSRNNRGQAKGAWLQQLPRATTTMTTTSTTATTILTTPLQWPAVGVVVKVGVPLLEGLGTILTLAAAAMATTTMTTSSFSQKRRADHALPGSRCSRFEQRCSSRLSTREARPTPRLLTEVTRLIGFATK